MIKQQNQPCTLQSSPLVIKIMEYPLTNTILKANLGYFSLMYISRVCTTSNSRKLKIFLHQPFWTFEDNETFPSFYYLLSIQILHSLYTCQVFTCAYFCLLYSLIYAISIYHCQYSTIMQNQSLVH